MTKPAWTEGEWTIERDDVDADTFLIHGPDTRTYNDTIAMVLGQANANLMLVAPEMYLALESPTSFTPQQIEALLARARGEFTTKGEPA